METFREHPIENESKPEKGSDVRILAKFIRHGERDKEGRLIDLGREITKERAQESGIHREDFHKIRAIGSNAGSELKSPTGEIEEVVPRAFETAQIYANEIAGEEATIPRMEEILSYETIISKMPYNHVEIYNANVPENFEELHGEERVQAAKHAQDKVMDYFFSLDTPEATTYRKEVAGAFAYLVDYFRRLEKRFNSNSEVMFVAGTHGGSMELLLQEALVRVDQERNKTVGFKHIDEIGGGFSPSEAYNADITTDEHGDYKRIDISFDSPDRPQYEEMYLDEDKLTELKDFYIQLHPERKR